MRPVTPWIPYIYTWSFTTSDVTAPTVVSTTPSNGASGVSRASDISATFSEAMDPATITTSTFTVTSMFGPVSGTVSYNAATKTATFVPTADHYGLTEYQVTITSGATDANGTALAQAQWGFRTARARVTKLISRGSTFFITLMEDGTAWGWGRNSMGQLGDGTRLDRASPVHNRYLNNLVDIDLGINRNTIAVKNDGTVWAWGTNNMGQVGDGTTTNRLEPVQVLGITTATRATCGQYHCLALLLDGTVMSWGNNSNGQLGTTGSSDFNAHTTPALVLDLNSVIDIGAGNYVSFALKSDGTVWVWGMNIMAYLGDGSLTDRPSPVRGLCQTAVGNVCQAAVGNACEAYIDGAVAISAGQNHAFAKLEDGTVRGWGMNGSSILGDGTTTQRCVATAPTGLGAVTKIVAGVNSSAALKADGSVWTWGNNSLGAIGDGTTTSRTTPVQSAFSADVNITDIAVGGTNVAILKDNGMTVMAAGSNVWGELGDGSGLGGHRLRPVSGITGTVTQISLGYFSPDTGTHAVVLTSDSRVWAWGKNDKGQLGDGTFDAREMNSPALVRNSNDTGDLSNVIAISANGSHTLAIVDDNSDGNGTVYAWGLNTSGQLGDNSTTNSNLPVLVKIDVDGDGTLDAEDGGSITNAVRIAAGGTRSYAITADGKVWGWGAAKVGDGTSTQRKMAVQICRTYSGSCTEKFEGATEIYTGTSFALALRMARYSVLALPALNLETGQRARTT